MLVAETCSRRVRELAAHMSKSETTRVGMATGFRAGGRHAGVLAMMSRALGFV